MKKKLYREPTESDLQLILAVNPDVNPDEIVVVKLMAVHNLKTRGDYAWHKDDLEVMNKEYVGKRLLINHDWEHIEAINGIVFDSQLMQYPEVDERYNPEFNKQDNAFIFQRYGFWGIELMCYIPKNSVVMKALESGLFNKDIVSFGAHGDTSAHCPFSGYQLQFKPDADYDMQMQCDSMVCKNCVIAIWGTSDFIKREDIPQNIPYFEFYIRKGLDEPVEISYVSSPNLPGVGHLELSPN